MLSSFVLSIVVDEVAIGINEIRDDGVIHLTYTITNTHPELTYRLLRNLLKIVVNDINIFFQNYVFQTRFASVTSADMMKLIKNVCLLIRSPLENVKITHMATETWVLITIKRFNEMIIMTDTSANIKKVKLAHLI